MDPFFLLPLVAVQVSLLDRYCLDRKEALQLWLCSEPVLALRTQR
jgi:hypothetical protein